MPEEERPWMARACLHTNARRSQKATAPKPIEATRSPMPKAQQCRAYKVACGRRSVRGQALWRHKPRRSQKATAPKPIEASKRS